MLNESLDSSTARKFEDIDQQQSSKYMSENNNEDDDSDEEDQEQQRKYKRFTGKGIKKQKSIKQLNKQKK